MKILITDGLAKQGLELLKAAEGVEVDERKGISPEELTDIIKDYEGLVVRSATKVTKEVIEASGGRLRIIGRAGIGIDNIDLDAATRNGVAVMNTPESNSITTAEHTITLLLSLARRIPQAHSSIKSGKWERNKYKGVEVHGKTIGLVGLGNIGKLVAERAMGLKMKAIAYDPYLSKEAAKKLSIELVSLDELFRRSDVITVHTPLTDETRDLVNSESFEKMKEGVIVINCARGGIVNEADMAEALREGKVGGAAFDVYTSEPIDPENPVLSVDENIVLTPHLGASTEEAQIKVGTTMAEQLIDFAQKGVVRNAVNMPSLTTEQLAVMRPYMSICEKIGSLHGQLCKGAVRTVEVTYEGEAAEMDCGYLTVSVLKGFLSHIMDISVTYVNAPSIAEERRIKVVESKSAAMSQYTSLITVTVATREATNEISGSVFSGNHGRIVKVNGVEIDVVPEGFLLVSHNYDRPGFIGSMCTVLGKNGVNIGRMHLGRKSAGGEAIVFTNVDTEVSEEVIQEILTVENIISVTQVSFSDE